MLLCFSLLLFRQQNSTSEISYATACIQKRPHTSFHPALTFAGSWVSKCRHWCLEWCPVLSLEMLAMRCIGRSAWTETRQSSIKTSATLLWQKFHQLREKQRRVFRFKLTTREAGLRMCHENAFFVGIGWGAERQG